MANACARATYSPLGTAVLVTRDPGPINMNEDSRAERPRRWIPGLVPLITVASSVAWVISCGGPSSDAWWLDAPDRYEAPKSAPTAVRKPRSPRDRADARGGEVSLGLLTEPESFNPYTAKPSADAIRIWNLLFPRLAIEEPDYFRGPPTFRPHLAARWKVAEDLRSIDFELRDAKWSDGKPITSADVRFSWQAAAHPEVAWLNASIVDHIEDVEIRSDREFTVRFGVASRYNQMDVCDLNILPLHVYGAVPFNSWKTHGKWLAEAKVSAGPWRLASFRPGELITLAPNPTAWAGAQPRLDRVHFRLVDGVDPMLAAILSGEIDCLRKVSYETIPTLQRTGEISLYSFQSRSYGFLAWNLRNQPLEDARIRRALTMAIDRNAIVDAHCGPGAKVGGPHVISSFWASHPEIEPLPYAPSAARALIEEAGFRPAEGRGGYANAYGRRLRIRLLHQSGNPTRESIAERIRSDLESIGVAVELKPRDFGALYDEITSESPDFDAALLVANSATKVDLKPMFHSSSIGAGRNFMAYRDAEVDAWIDEARTTLDEGRELELWRNVQTRLHRDQPLTMLFEGRGFVAVRKRVQNVRVTSLTAYDNLHEWTVADVGDER